MHCKILLIKGWVQSNMIFLDSEWLEMFMRWQVDVNWVKMFGVGVVVCMYAYAVLYYVISYEESYNYNLNQDT